MLLDQALADELLGFDADGEMISPRPHDVVDGCKAHYACAADPVFAGQGVGNTDQGRGLAAEEGGGD